MDTQKNSDEIQQLKKELEQEELQLKILKIRWEKEKYIREKDQPLKNHQEQLKNEEIKYKINQLKYGNIRKWILAIACIAAALFPAGLLLFWKPALFQNNYDMEKILDVTLQINIIWANVILLGFKTIIILFSLFVIYKILFHLFEKI